MRLCQGGPEAKKDSVLKNVHAYVLFSIQFPLTDPISCSVECVPCYNPWNVIQEECTPNPPKPMSQTWQPQ